MTEAATELQERVVDDSYIAVFPISRQQLATHCADTNNEAESENYGLDNIRVSKEGDNIVVESTSGTVVLKVEENGERLKNLPFSVNPSETDQVLLKNPVYIPGKVAEKLLKSLPQRKGASAEPWQREVVFSYASDNTIEVGYADKQGNAVLERVDSIGDTAKQFPPIEQAWPPIAPTLRVGFKVDILRKMVEILETAEIETVALEFFERTNGEINYDAGRAMKFYGVEPRPGKTLPRTVTGLLMPFNIQ
jgi:hypothetical protein